MQRLDTIMQTISGVHSCSPGNIRSCLLWPWPPIHCFLCVPMHACEYIYLTDVICFLVSLPTVHQAVYDLLQKCSQAAGKKYFLTSSWLLQAGSSGASPKAESNPTLPMLCCSHQPYLVLPFAPLSSPWKSTQGPEVAKSSIRALGSCEAWWVFIQAFFLLLTCVLIKQTLSVQCSPAVKGQLQSPGQLGTSTTKGTCMLS